MNIAVLQACFEYDAIDSDDENDVEESDSDSMSIITDPGKSLTPHNAKPSKCVSKAIKVFQVPEASAEKPWPAIHEDLVSESLLDIELPILMDSSNLDRKSTRLNSSHQIISYAVFCLKKKNHIQS